MEISENFLTKDKEAIYELINKTGMDYKRIIYVCEIIIKEKEIYQLEKEIDLLKKIEVQ